VRHTVVRSVEHLQALCGKEEREFHLLLSGGAFSRKTIRWDGDVFAITHHISDTTEELDPAQFRNPRLCNLMQGIRKHALWMVS